MRVHGTVSVLTYHSIAVDTTPMFAPLTVHPSLFAEHMAAVRSWGLDVIPFGEVPQALAEGRDAVAITIDDGLADVAEHACPELARLGLPATLFVPSGYIGDRARWLPGADADRPILSRSAIADLAAEGFEIGSHGRSHIAADINDLAVVAEDALVSRLVLEECIGAPVRSFAYPFGYHSAAGRRAVRAAGFEQACAVGDLPARAADDRWALPRLQVWSQTTPESLLALIRWRPLPSTRGAARAKQRVWRMGRRWAGWGPAEAGRVAAVPT